jgi:hypothetical protein
MGNNKDLGIFSEYDYGMIIILNTNNNKYRILVKINLNKFEVDLNKEYANILIQIHMIHK